MRCLNFLPAGANSTTRHTLPWPEPTPPWYSARHAGRRARHLDHGGHEWHAVVHFGEFAENLKEISPSLLDRIEVSARLVVTKGEIPLGGGVGRMVSFSQGGWPQANASLLRMHGPPSESGSPASR